MGHPVRGRHRPFAFALVLGWGTAAGVVALGVCSALADLAGGKPARKVLFNSAQLATALGAAGVVCPLAGGHSREGQVSLPAFAAAALAFFVVNNLLVEAVLVLAAPRGPALGRVRQGWACGAWVSAVPLGMAPVVAVVAQSSLGLLPGLALLSSRRATSSSGTCWPPCPTSGPAGGDPLRPQAVLAVANTGPGVPGADRERIFERFTQLDSGPPGGPAGLAWGSTSPAGWPATGTASCS